MGPFWGGGAVFSFSPPGCCWATGWSLLLCLFLRCLRSFCSVSCRRLPLGGYANFSGSSCLSCSCGGALSVGFAVSLVRLLVFHLVPCSSSGACGFGQLPLSQVALRGLCLFCHRMPGLLLRWWLRLGYNPSLVFSVLLLRRLACWGSLGSAPCVREHPWGCDCSLGGSVVVPSGSPCLLGFVTCSVISSCGSQPLWVLCSVHCLVSLALGWVRFWPAVSTAPVRCGVCSLGCPSWLVLLLRSLLVLHLLLQWAVSSCCPCPWGFGHHMGLCVGRFPLLRGRRYTQAYVGGLRTSAWDSS